jgi:hypothetical protein
VRADARDLERAAQRDFARVRAQMIQRGYDPAVVDQAIHEADQRNRALGVYQ